VSKERGSRRENRGKRGCGAEGVGTGEACGEDGEGRK